MSQSLQASRLSSSRIQTIDALRGFALAGVAVIHVVTEFTGGNTPEGVELPYTLGVLDKAVGWLLHYVIKGKFFAIFSILFGLSFSIQIASAAKKGDNFVLRFCIRSMILLGIGLLHQLFFRGDILTVYALLSFVLIPFHRVGPKWVIGVAALFLFSLPRFGVYFFTGQTGQLGILGPIAEGYAFQYYQTLKMGTLGEVFSVNGGLGLLRKLEFQAGPAGRLYLTFGYFLLGLWIGKTGILKDIPGHSRQIRNILLGALLGFLPAFVASKWIFRAFPHPVDLAQWQHVVGINLEGWVDLATTIILIGTFVLTYQLPLWERILKFFVPYGRMALTNYLMQALLGTFFFFGWGLGYLGSFPPFMLFLIACLLVVVQTLFSRWWLGHFKYGPFEWLWRSGTYLRIQPMYPPAMPFVRKVRAGQWAGESPSP